MIMQKIWRLRLRLKMGKKEDLAQYLSYQINNKKRIIRKNNCENIDLRMDIQHLEQAIDIILNKTSHSSEEVKKR